MEDFWKEKKVFITGCTGFIGSWLAKVLLDKGAHVTGLVHDIVPNSNFSHLNLDKKINIVYGDITDYGTVLRALNDYETEFCFHLAAQAIVGTAKRSPLSTFNINIKGTWNILEACRNLSTVKGVVVASSDKAYGPQIKLPYKEETQLLGKEPYEVSKSCADLISQSYYSTYGLKVAITRCVNIYGGGDTNFSRIIPETMKSIVENKTVIIRSDGTFVRDYMHVLDAVSAYLRVAEKINEKGVAGEAFNFGVETPISVLELVKKIIEVTGKTDAKYKILGQAGDEIKEQYSDCGKAREVLGWKPEYSLESGLKETYSWYKAYLKPT